MSWCWTSCSPAWTASPSAGGCGKTQKSPRRSSCSPRATNWADKLTGFSAGADDYLVKPFDMPELVARIEALARRAKGLTARYRIGELTLDTDTLEVRRQGWPVALTGTAFEVLRVLMREHPKVVSRRELERDVWQNEPPESDALRSHLYNLRQALDRPFDRPLIVTLPGRGYRLDLPESDSGSRDDTP